MQDTITTPTAGVADATTAKILSTAPPAPALNPAPSSAPTPSTAPAPTVAPAAKTFTAIAKKLLIYQGKTYAAGATITAPLADLRKFASIVTINPRVKTAPVAKPATPSKKG